MKRLILAFVVVASQNVLGCPCLDVQPLCNSLPVFADKDAAIFIGVVKDVYPGETDEEYQRAVSAVLSSKKSPVTFDNARAGLLRLREGVLSSEEKKDILGRPLYCWPIQRHLLAQARRVRFELLERFVGADGGNFELFTGIDRGGCVFEFKKGQSYLVVAHRDPTSGRWSTSNCSRTELLDQADRDLAALRAWKKEGHNCAELSVTMQEVQGDGGKPSP